MVRIIIKIKNNRIPHESLFTIVILCIAAQTLVQDEAFATAKNVSSQAEDWDRLLIEEIPSLRENVDNIVNALNEGNYSMAREQIDDIQSSDNWFNVRNELEARDETNLVSRFENVLSDLETSLKTQDSVAETEQAKMLSKGLDDIVGKLAEPAVDMQRLIITTSIIGIVIGSGLYIIPKVRKKFNIKY
jgi:hypothetical protein